MLECHASGSSAAAGRLRATWVRGRHSHDTAPLTTSNTRTHLSSMDSARHRHIPRRWWLRQQRGRRSQRHRLHRRRRPHHAACPHSAALAGSLAPSAGCGRSWTSQQVCSRGALVTSACLYLDTSLAGHGCDGADHSIPPVLARSCSGRVRRQVVRPRPLPQPVFCRMVSALIHVCKQCIAALALYHCMSNLLNCHTTRPGTSCPTSLIPAPFELAPSSTTSRQGAPLRSTRCSPAGALCNTCMTGRTKSKA